MEGEGEEEGKRSNDEGDGEEEENIDGRDIVLLEKAAHPRTADVVHLFEERECVVSYMPRM